MGRAETCRTSPSTRSDTGLRSQRSLRDDTSSLSQPCRTSRPKASTSQPRLVRGGGHSKSSGSIAGSSQGSTATACSSSRYSGSESSRRSSSSGSLSAVETSRQKAAHGARTARREQRGGERVGGNYRDGPGVATEYLSCSKSRGGSDANFRRSEAEWSGSGRSGDSMRTPRSEISQEQSSRGSAYYAGEVDTFSECDSVDEENRKAVHHTAGRVGITYGLGDHSSVPGGPGQRRQRRWYRPYETPGSKEPKVPQMGHAGRAAAGLGTEQRTLRQQKTVEWNPDVGLGLRGQEKMPCLIMPPEARNGRIFTKEVPRYDESMRSVAHSHFQPPPRRLNYDAHTQSHARHAGQEVPSRRVYTDITRSGETRDGKGRMTKAERNSWNEHVYKDKKGKTYDDAGPRRTSYDRGALFMDEADGELAGMMEDAASSCRRTPRSKRRGDETLEERLRDNANRFRGHEKATTYESSYRQSPAPPAFSL
eukprot:TRINITY_DN123553_c0_g1_i1.p1 TRINITY_DN123553_c0_g1~~TRINITY_DN123553_c0_g1_i1.p1  ORF type:complete len:480 (-),score=64.41 TRINITY_DN123553_c0_g1_i1:150-1589(-)